MSTTVAFGSHLPSGRLSAHWRQSYIGTKLAEAMRGVNPTASRPIEAELRFGRLFDEQRHPLWVPSATPCVLKSSAMKAPFRAVISELAAPAIENFIHGLRKEYAATDGCSSGDKAARLPKDYPALTSCFTIDGFPVWVREQCVVQPKHGRGETVHPRFRYIPKDRPEVEESTIPFLIDCGCKTKEVHPPHGATSSDDPFGTLSNSDVAATVCSRPLSAEDVAKEKTESSDASDGVWRFPKPPGGGFNGKLVSAQRKENLPRHNTRIVHIPDKGGMDVKLNFATEDPVLLPWQEPPVRKSGEVELDTSPAVGEKLKVLPIGMPCAIRHQGRCTIGIRPHIRLDWSNVRDIHQAMDFTENF